MRFIPSKEPIFFLAANVKYAGTDTTILPAYTVKNIRGAKIGFIGMTLKETPSIVTAAGIAGLDFTDEVATANALVPVLRKQGVNAIVVLIHQGGSPKRTATYPAAPTPPRGPVWRTATTTPAHRASSTRTASPSNSPLTRQSSPSPRTSTRRST